MMKPRNHNLFHQKIIYQQAGYQLMLVHDKNSGRAITNIVNIAASNQKYERLASVLLTCGRRYDE